MPIKIPKNVLTHSNPDIPVDFMLNFPKIKKVLTDQDKLWDFLTHDDKYKSRSYELEHSKRMLRKKGIQVS